jgi:hypothetical protein
MRFMFSPSGKRPFFCLHRDKGGCSLFIYIPYTLPDMAKQYTDQMSEVRGQGRPDDEPLLSSARASTKDSRHEFFGLLPSSVLCPPSSVLGLSRPLSVQGTGFQVRGKGCRSSREYERLQVRPSSGFSALRPLSSAFPFTTDSSSPRGRPGGGW